jgi:hypothetical protein
VLDPFVSLHIVMQTPPPPLADQAEAEAIIPIEIVSSGSLDIKMESHPSDQAEAIIPIDIVSSGSRSAAEEAGAIIPMETESSRIATMSRPTKESGAIIPMETVSNDSATTTTTVMTRRSAANRTESWYIPPPPPPRRGTRQRQLPSYFASLPPQAEDIPAARKKPRLEEYLPTTRARTRSTKSDEAARKNASPDISVGLSRPASDDDIDDANTDANTDIDPVTDTQPNAVATGYWTPEEDVKLTSAVTNTSKKRRGKEYMTDWVAIAVLVPGRTNIQCYNRWHGVLDPSIDPTSARTGAFTPDEDAKLKDAVQTHGEKDWAPIAALVPGRTRQQCYNRWRDVLDPSIDRTARITGKWTSVEESKLMNAVKTHGGKNWIAIAALIPSRTNKQCNKRWHDALDPSIDRSNERTGRWTGGEDSKLLEAVQTYGGKNWNAIAALMPGRTKIQCNKRWHDSLDPSINRANERTGKWTAVEDSKLMNAVKTHGGKNWIAIAALVPGRTKIQCNNRWRDALDPNIGGTTRRTGKWTAVEDSKLMNAVKTHGGKDWIAITALVPGRTRQQCCSRWRDMKPNHRSRRQQAEGSGTNARWQELG